MMTPFPTPLPSPPNQDAPGGTAAHAGALAALCLLGSLNNTLNTSKSAGDKDTGKENVGPAALALLLESRTAWVLAAAAASGNDHDDDPSSNEQAAVVAAERVQRRLGRAARAIRETVLDVYRIFLSPSASGAGGGAVSVAMIGAEEEEDGEEAEGEVVGMLRAGLGKAQVREALTAWVAQHVQATHALATVRHLCCVFVWVCGVSPPDDPRHMYTPPPAAPRSQLTTIMHINTFNDHSRPSSATYTPPPGSLPCASPSGPRPTTITTTARAPPTVRRQRGSGRRRATWAWRSTACGPC